MKDLAQLLSAEAGAAFAALGLDPALGAVRRSDRPELADFQCNGAMAAAKAAGRKPQELAQDIIAAWKTDRAGL
ncbi:MAG: arginine--tRNA ligase, partial [Caulobacterales bacterium]